jgi:N-acetylneuraminic acid mutarotase
MSHRRNSTGRSTGVLVAILAVTGTSAAVDLTWAPRADVIGEAYGRGLHAAGVIGDRVYVAGGGFIGSSLWASYSSALVYDPAADAWSTLAAMPTLRTAPGAAVAPYQGQDRLYVIGGVDLTGFPIDHVGHPSIEEYDPVTDSWRTVGANLPDIPFVWGICAVEAGGLVYLMGGARTSFGGATARLASYDPDSDAYTVLAPMPGARSDGACAVVGGEIYYIGGYAGGSWGGLPSSQVFVYDIAGDTWQTSPTPAPTPRANAAALAIETDIVVTGGWDGSGTYSGMYNTVDAYDTVLDSWAVDLPDRLGCVEDDGATVRGRAGLSLHTAHDGAAYRVYAVGGNIGISVPTRCNESAPHPLLFADGFETGDTTRWSSTTPPP